MPASKTPRHAILIVDDEREVTSGLRFALERGGFDNIMTTNDSRTVRSLLDEFSIGVVLLDISMPEMGGTELLSYLQSDYPEISVIMVTALNQVETAVKCMQGGAFDYLTKPVESRRLITSVNKAVEMVELKNEYADFRNRVLHSALNSPEAFADIVTRSPQMFSLFQYVETIAPTLRPVLITGETGAGKELFAKAIHRLSGVQGRMLSVNIAGLDDTVFSDTLFGHTRGAFTGATGPRDGIIHKAEGGTLFLDELGDLTPANQTKLLRLLQEGEYFPLGADVPRRTTARVIVATNRPIRALKADPGFRKDLYHRIQTHHIHLPPLRERHGDIPLLTDHFVEQAAKSLNRPTPTIPDQVYDLLGSYGFPGNIRELESMVFDAVSRHPSSRLSLPLIREHIEKQREFSLVPGGPHGPTETTRSSAGSVFSTVSELPTLKDVQRLLIQEAMKRAGGKQTIAAGMIGISQPGLSKALKRIQADDPL